MDVRIVAATNRDLAAEVDKGTFRSDLYFRLSAFPLALPPLRERTHEIKPMALVLLERACAERGRAVPHLSTAAIERLHAHSWPGNVRELRSVMMRALLFAPKGASELGADDIERAITPGGGAAPRPAPAASPTDAPGDDERARIVRALTKHAGNQSAAAEELGIARRTLINKLDKLGIARPRKGKGAK